MERGGEFNENEGGDDEILNMTEDMEGDKSQEHHFFKMYCLPLSTGLAL